MNQNQRAEFSTGRGGDQRLPNGQLRPLTPSERVQIERTAALRDASIEDVEQEYRKRR